MSTGGYGGPPHGGGWDPSGGPAGGPQGYGGWGGYQGGAPAPPPGAPPGYQQHQGFGGPPQPPPEGVGRLMKHSLFGALIGGALASIPLFNLLNGCCCMLTNIGAVAAVALYLKAHPYERMSDGDSAFCGMIAGAAGGLIAALLGLMINVALGSALAGVYGGLPPSLAGRFAIQSLATGFLMAPVNLILGGAFGALSGFVALSLFFKDRRR
jgi:hypothetical protein